MNSNCEKIRIDIARILSSQSKWFHYKERSILEAVRTRTIDDILKFPKVTECCSSLLAIDLEKGI